MKKRRKKINNYRKWIGGCSQPRTRLSTMSIGLVWNCLPTTPIYILNSMLYHITNISFQLKKTSQCWMGHTFNQFIVLFGNRAWIIHYSTILENNCISWTHLLYLNNNKTMATTCLVAYVPPPPLSPPAFTHSLQRFGMLLISLSMSFEGSPPTHPRVLSWGHKPSLEDVHSLEHACQPCLSDSGQVNNARWPVYGVDAFLPNAVHRHKQCVGEHYRA